MSKVTYPEREKVIEQSKSITNQMQGVSLGFAYNLYDVVRLQLEELHRIGDTMELIFDIIQKQE